MAAKRRPGEFPDLALAAYFHIVDFDDVLVEVGEYEGDGWFQVSPVFDAVDEDGDLVLSHRSPVYARYHELRPVNEHTYKYMYNAVAPEPLPCPPSVYKLQELLEASTGAILSADLLGSWTEEQRQALLRAVERGAGCEPPSSDEQDRP